MSKELDDLGVGETQIFGSIKVLEGYMLFYHLLYVGVCGQISSHRGHHQPNSEGLYIRQEKPRQR